MKAVMEANHSDLPISRNPQTSDTEGSIHGLVRANVRLPPGHLCLLLLQSRGTGSHLNVRFDSNDLRLDGSLPK